MAEPASHDGAARAIGRGATPLFLSAAAALLLALTGCASDQTTRTTETTTMPAATAADSGTAATDADATPPTGRAVIDFAQFRGRIKDWRAVGNDALLIEDSSGNWYRAEFMSPCHGLPFAEAIGFVTDATNQIDRFSSIMVRHERCWFRSFQRVEEPQ